MARVMTMSSAFLAVLRKPGQRLDQCWFALRSDRHFGSEENEAAGEGMAATASDARYEHDKEFEGCLHGIESPSRAQVLEDGT